MSKQVNPNVGVGKIRVATTAPATRVWVPVLNTQLEEWKGSFQLHIFSPPLKKTWTLHIDTTVILYVCMCYMEAHILYRVHIILQDNNIRDLLLVAAPQDPRLWVPDQKSPGKPYQRQRRAVTLGTVAQPPWHHECTLTPPPPPFRK